MRSLISNQSKEKMNLYTQIDFRTLHRMDYPIKSNLKQVQKVSFYNAINFIYLKAINPFQILLNNFPKEKDKSQPLILIKSNKEEKKIIGYKKTGYFPYYFLSKKKQGKGLTKTQKKIRTIYSQMTEKELFEKWKWFITSRVRQNILKNITKCLEKKENTDELIYSIHKTPFKLNISQLIICNYCENNFPYPSLKIKDKQIRKLMEYCCSKCKKKKKLKSKFYS